MKKYYLFPTKNWRCFGFATAFVVSGSLNLQAQTIPVKQWDKTFGGINSEMLQDLQQTADGGYILGGYSASPISGDKTENSKGSNDFWLVKLDGAGNKVWDRTLGGDLSDGLHVLKQTADGGYILGGASQSGISGDKTGGVSNNPDIWIIKVDASGNKHWDKTFGGINWEDLTALQQTSDGGYIVGGFSSSGISRDKTQASNGDFDYWILKLDASGNKLWDKAFGGSGEDILNSVQQTADGGYILGGYSGSGIGGDKTQALQGTNDFWLVKVDANGNKQWDKSYGSNGGEHLRSLQQTADGGFILGGDCASGIGGDKSQLSRGMGDYWILKLDALGIKQWDKTYGGTSSEQLASIQQTPDGGYLLGGTSTSGIGGDKTDSNTGFWVLKLDGSGSKIWDKTLGSVNNPAPPYLYAMRQTADGGIVLGGSTTAGIGGDKSQPSQGMMDFWVVKLNANPTGIKKSAATFNFIISPNPSQGKFTIQSSNLSSPKAEVIISDLLGRVILKQKFRTTNSRLSEEITLPAAKGIYLLQMVAGEQIFSRKIVVE